MLHCEHFVCLFTLSLFFNPFCFNVLGQKKKKGVLPLFLSLVISLLSVYMLSLL